MLIAGIKTIGLESIPVKNRSDNCQQQIDTARFAQAVFTSAFSVQTTVHSPPRCQ